MNDEESPHAIKITKSDLKTLDADMRKWSDAFLKSQGWSSREKRVAPEGGMRARTPQRDLDRRVATAEDDRKKAEDRLDEIADKLSTKNAALKKLKNDDPEFQKLFEEKEKLETEQRHASEELKRCADEKAHRERLADTLTSVEKNLESELKAARKQTRKLEKAAEDGSDDNGNGDEKEKAVNFKIISKALDGARQNVRNAHENLLKYEKRGEKQIRYFTEISTQEARILDEMLKQAFLTWDAEKSTKSLTAALDIVRAAQAKLATFRAARTGMKIHEEKDCDPEIEAALIEAEAVISPILSLGFRQHHAALISEMKGLEKSANAAKNADEVKGCLEKATAFAERCAKDLDLCKDTEKRMKALEKQIATFRMLAQDLKRPDKHDPADSFDKRLSGLVDPPKLDRWQADLIELEEDVAEALEWRRERAIKAKSIDTDRLELMLERFKDRYDDFFKKKGADGFKMIEDSQTGEDKRAKKDKHIPREALQEIEARLKTAELLLKTQSVEALAQANELLEGIFDFEASLEKDAKLYRIEEMRIKATRDRINTLSGKYAAFKIGERLALDQRVKDFEAVYKSRPPFENEQESVAFLHEGKALEKDVLALYGKYSTFCKEAGKVEKYIKRLNALSKGLNIDGVAVDGYHGDFHAILSKAREAAEERDDASLDKALNLIRNIDDDDDGPAPSTVAEEAKRAADLLVSFRSWGIDPRDFKDGAGDVFEELLVDIRSGQETEEKIKKEKADFDDRMKTATKTLSGIISRLEKLKEDTSEAEGLKSQLDSLKMEMEPDEARNYKEKLKELEGFEGAIERLEKASKALKTFKEASLKDAAESCANSLMGFRAEVEGFSDFIINKEGYDVAKHGIDAKALNRFGRLITKSLPKSEINALKTDAAAYDELDKLTDDARKLRESMLTKVRSMMSVMESFGPVIHFRMRPFADAGAHYATAVRQLPRLEVKILTQKKKSA